MEKKSKVHPDPLSDEEEAPGVAQTNSPDALVPTEDKDNVSDTKSSRSIRSIAPIDERLLRSVSQSTFHDDNDSVHTDTGSIPPGPPIAKQLPPLERDHNSAEGNIWSEVPEEEFQQAFESLVDAGVGENTNILVKRREDGWTIMHECCSTGRSIVLLQLLIDFNFPVNVQDDTGWSPLHEAAQEGHLPMCRLLIDAGADPNVRRYEDNMTPLMAAAEVGNDESASWFLQQPNTWSRRWEPELFAFILKKSPRSLEVMLDEFAKPLNHTRRGLIAVQYKDMDRIYGPPEIPIKETMLELVLASDEAMSLLSHRVIRYIIRAKWKGFARKMYRQEFSIYFCLVLSTSIINLQLNPTWTKLTTAHDYLVLICRALSWVCTVYLLAVLERRELMGRGIKEYISSPWNWLNAFTYTSLLVAIPFEFIPGYDIEKDCLLACVSAMLWLNVLQFLQVSPSTGILVAMMGKMTSDVAKFLMLYGVFQVGFTAAFYIIFQGKTETGFGTFGESFVTVYLMLFGQLSPAVFYPAAGARATVAIILLMFYLMCVAVVLLNILIAMMAQTYSEVLETAEVQALQSQADSILRMEKTLTGSARKNVYNSLVTRSPEKIPSLQKSGTVAQRMKDISSQKFTQTASTFGKGATAVLGGASAVARQGMTKMEKNIGGASVVMRTMESAANKTIGATKKAANKTLDVTKSLDLEKKLLGMSSLDDENTVMRFGLKSKCSELKTLDDGIRYEQPGPKKDYSEELGKLRDELAQVKRIIMHQTDLLRNQSEA